MVPALKAAFRPGGSQIIALPLRLFPTFVLQADLARPICALPPDLARPICALPPAHQSFQNCESQAHRTRSVQRRLSLCPRLERCRTKR